MDVAGQLKRTSKGQLVYNRGPPTQEFLEDCASPPSLSSFHTENDHKYQEDNRQYHFDNRHHKESRHFRNNLENQQKQKRSIDREILSDTSSNDIDDMSLKDLCITLEPNKPRIVITVSPDYGRSLQAIKHYEDSQTNRAKLVVSAKEEEFKEHSKRLNKERNRKMEDVEQKSLYKAIYIQEKTEEHYRQREAEQQLQCQKLKEEHMKHAKMLEIRHQKLQEEMRRKDLEKQQRLEKVNVIKKDVKSMEGKLASLQQLGAHYNRLSDEIQTLMDKVKDTVTQATQFEEQQREVNPDVEKKYISARALCVDVYEEIKKKIEAEEKRLKDMAAAKAAEEARKKAEEEQKAQQQAAAAAASAAASAAAASAVGTVKSQSDVTAAVLKATGNEELCVEPAAFVEYTRLQEELQKTEESVKLLNTPQNKKLKFDFQKSINIPINAISPVSGDHLCDKLRRLLNLLSGQQVEVSNKYVSVTDHPQGRTFCKHLVAKMIVKKGEELVSSKHEASFAIAMVSIGIWAKHADVGSLLLAHFHSLCPYIVPYHIPRQQGQTAEDYHKALGYKYDLDGVVEKQDKFLKRMSGIMRLYAAILVSSPPEGTSPHGVEHAWGWLARMMNIRPLPDITATMIYDMLYVTGHLLHKTYHKQFQKLLHYLIKEYLPKLKSVASAGGGGPVSRLETLLQNTVKNHGQMVPPEGYLPQTFWFS